MALQRRGTDNRRRPEHPFIWAAVAGGKTDEQPRKLTPRGLAVNFVLGAAARKEISRVTAISRILAQCEKRGARVYVPFTPAAG